MNRKYCLAALLLVAMLALSQAAQAAVYKYVDDNGVTNFTNDINSVPKQYRGRVQQVKTQIQVQTPGGQPQPVQESTTEKLLGKGNLSWQEFVVKDQDGNPTGLDLRKLMVQSMFESKLVFWLGGELLFSVLMLILLVVFINWPTARGRLMAMAGVAAFWIIGSALVLVSFTRPALMDFLAISRGYLSEVEKQAPLNEDAKAKIKDLNQKLGQMQEKML
jgi:hypothetical protein